MYVVGAIVAFLMYIYMIRVIANEYEIYRRERHLRNPKYTLRPPFPEFRMNGDIIIVIALSWGLTPVMLHYTLLAKTGRGLLSRVKSIYLTVLNYYNKR